MGLYKYRVAVRGGGEKTGRITAKSEPEARKQVAAKMAIVKWLSFLEERPASPRPAPARPPRESPKPKTLSKLELLLYLQLDRCFFCGEPLRKEDASIEHLNPKSKGGTNGDDNVVVCHATLNRTFG